MKSPFEQSGSKGDFVLSSAIAGNPLIHALSQLLLMAGRGEQYVFLGAGHAARLRQKGRTCQ